MIPMQDRINDIKLMSSSFIDNNQIGWIPVVDRVILTRTDSYFVFGKRVMVSEGELCFVIKNHVIYKDLTESAYRFDNLINDGYIEPMLIFINNKMIPWSNIVFIHSYQYDYIGITSYTEEFNGTNVISIPFSVYYNEMGIEIEGQKQIFRFNEDGLFDNDGSIIISTDKKDIFLHTEYTMNDIIKSDKLAEMPHIFKNNLIFFKEESLFKFGDLTIGTNNTIRISNDNKLVRCLIFYNGYFKTMSITDIYPNRYDIENYISDIKPINVHHGATIEKAISDIYEYYPRLLSPSIEKYIETHTYTGSYINSILDDKNNLTMLRDKAEPLDCYAIMLVNGMLYEYYYLIKYDLNTFTIPVPTLFNDSDIVEIIYVKKVNNSVVQTTTDEEGYVITNGMELNGMMLFSDARLDALFPDVEHTSYTNYSLDYTINNGSIILEDPEYMKQKITFCYSNQFRYCHYTITEEHIRLQLSKSFNFCNKSDHYVVMLNGRVIKRESYELIFVNKDTPFNDMSVYLYMKLNIGDTVDIFYFPISLAEISDMSIDDNGYVDTESYDIDKTTCMIFANGKKLNESQIIETASKSFKISTDVLSKNIFIYDHAMLAFKEKIKDIINNRESLWDRIYRVIPKEKFSSIIDSYNTVTDAEAVKMNDIPKEELVNQILRDYYTQPGSYVGRVMDYDFYTDTITLKDAEDNFVLPIGDSNKYINIIFEREDSEVK